MAMSRSVSSSFALVLNTKPLVGALAAALISCPSAYAASFGHSRIVSGLGQPLGIDIPVSQLSADDLRSLAVTPAPLSAWQQAGLTPPVALSDMRLQVVDGYTAGIKVIQLRSSTPFDQPIADVLLDVRTAAGQQRYQVSLLAHGGAVSAAAQRSSSLRDPSGAAASTQAGYTIKVRRGDTMFAIARRNAVPDASIYQLMIALQRANPQAFIHGNINLVKAGASLKMPSMADITAISDREARRIFMRQAHEFALYRQRAAAGAGVVGAGGDAAAGQVSPGGAEPQMEAADQSRDQLRLSSAAANGRTGAAPGGAAAAGGAGSGLSTDARSDDQVATRKGIAESEQRVSQLEENVKHLSEALRAQGGAASGLVVDGAKGLSQSLADAVGGSPDGQAGSAAPGGAAAGGGTAGRPGQAAGGARQSSAGAPGGTATHGAGAQAGNGGAGGGAQAADAAGGKPAGAATAGSTAAAGNGSGASAAAGTGSGSAAAGSSAASSSATGSTAPGGAAAQPSGRERSGNGAGAAAGGNATSAGGPGGSSGAASGGASAAASGGSTAAGSAAASPNGAGSSAAGPTASGGGSAAGGGTAQSPSGGKDADSGAGAAAGGGAANAAAGSAGADGAPSGSSAGSASGATGDGSTGAANGQARSGSGNGGSAAQAGGAGIAAPGLPGRAGDGGSAKGPGAAAGADKPAQGAAAGGKADAASSADSNSTKAEQSVSWLQEHMLGVITGVLAFIVLIIAWLLRRANSANRDGDGHGVITDAMVQEKLEQINLDLDDGAEPRARRH